MLGLLCVAAALRLSAKLVPNFRQEVRFAGASGRLGGFAHPLAGRPDHQENNESENEEIEHDGQERTPSQKRNARSLQGGIVGEPPRLSRRLLFVRRSFRYEQDPEQVFT